METKNGASENSETKQNQPHNHHFIPRFYLQHFVTKDTQGDKKKEKIYVILKKPFRGYYLTPLPIKIVGSKMDYNTFYTDMDKRDRIFFEKKLQPLEKKQASLLKTIKTEKSIKNIKKRQLASFVALMHLRSPNQRELIEQIFKIWKQPLVGSNYSIINQARDDNKSLLNFIYNEAQNKDFLEALTNFRYRLVKISDKNPRFFITSDDPVSFYCSDVSKIKWQWRFYCDQHLARNPGMKDFHIGSYTLTAVSNYDELQNENFEIFLPIGEKTGILLSHREDTADVIDTDDNLIDELNGRTIIFGDSQIYTSHNPEDNYIRELVDRFAFKSVGFSINGIPPDDTFMRNGCKIATKFICFSCNEDLPSNHRDEIAEVLPRVIKPSTPNERITNTIVLLKPIPSSHQYALERDWTEELKRYDGITLFAPIQTNGVGSHGRKWISDKEDFHVNLIFYCDKILPFSQIAAFTARELLENETCEFCVLRQGTQKKYLKVKWPNDIVIEDSDGNFKKIGGCLAEFRKEGSRYWVTIGVGINYNLENFNGINQSVTSVKCFLNSFAEKEKLLKEDAVKDLFTPEELKQPFGFFKRVTNPTTLFKIIENDFTRDKLYQSVQNFGQRWEQNLDFIQIKGLASFYETVIDYWLYLGQKVTVFDEDKQTQLTGKFEKLTDNGALQLACDDGKTEIVLNGTGLKPAENR